VELLTRAPAVRPRSSGFTLGTLLGIVRVDREGLQAFDTLRLSFGRAGFVFPLVVILYYLVGNT